ncbi:MAG: outer membrane lipoprotein carrier protein LolA [Deltaproteobacteria bacterium]|nr:outer membrane lipoprotein carrier protein LolA [Deltaproteobacteria bacterium]
MIGTPDAGAAATCPANVPALLKGFAAVTNISVDFVEEKHVALLKRPLVNKGTVVFAAPDQLVRRVDAPVPTAVWIKGGSLWMRDAHGSKLVDVAQWGPANVLINSFLYVLQGDTASLQQHYEMSLACAGTTWHLTLIPRQPDLRKVLQRLEINGAGPDVTQLSLLDGNGDLSVTRFGKPNKAVRHSPAQLQQFFASPASR